MTDHIAARIKIGDEQAFELLFRKYFVRLCCFANKFLNDPEEAKEIVQDVFTQLWEEKEDINPEESLNAFLFKVTQNNSINKLRRRKVESKYIEIYRFVYVEHTDISPYKSLLAYELNDNINRVICKMPPQCRKIFELSRFNGLKYREIASTLQISIKTVEAQMSKALMLLRTELKDYL